MQYIEHVPTQPKLMNITQVAKALSLSRAKVYQLIYQESLPVISFGRALRVSPTSLEKWLSEREKRLSN